MDMTRVLPEECLSLIISLTSPRDACGSALVSPVQKSVADSDAVWERFLPSDYMEIISKSLSQSLLSLSKKDLFFHLSFHPILIENGSMGQEHFQLHGVTHQGIGDGHFSQNPGTDIGFRERNVDMHVNVEGTTSVEVQSAFLDPPQNVSQQAHKKRDGWMEIEMGEFWNERGNDGTVDCILWEVDTGYHKQGLIVEGIELRPKAIGR
ncbi:hypothetical protein DITRI_Ditri15bG0060400 [Diplodiscus trichospermus]